VPNAALRFRPEETEAPPTPTPEERAARVASGGTGPAAAAGQLDRSSGKKPRKPGQTVYTVSPAGIGNPKPIEIRTGVSDGRFSQVAAGDLKLGDDVVVGLATTKAEAGTLPGGARGGSGGPGGRRF
jgi:HlyD family secretion protein